MHLPQCSFPNAVPPNAVYPIHDVGQHGGHRGGRINGGHGAEQDGFSIGDEPLFMDELTQHANAKMKG
jgi:hypothetical protein